MEQLLALEMVRVTEAAAIASARFMGRGDRNEADRAATEAMRRTMDEIEIAGDDRHRRGRARPGADALHRRAGRPPGRRGPGDPQRSTSRSTRSRARTSSPTARPNAITVLAASERGGLLNAPDTYLEKLCVGPVAAGQGRHPPASPTENLQRIAEALGRKVNDITVVILDRPRHDDLIARGARGRRPDQADLRRRPVGGDQLRRVRHGRPRA